MTQDSIGLVEGMTFPQKPAHDQHYKDLGEGKWAHVEGRQGIGKARQKILECIERFNSAEDKPNF